MYLCMYLSIYCFARGAGGGIRTPGLLLGKQMLRRLSYSRNLGNLPDFLYGVDYGPPAPIWQGDIEMVTWLDIFIMNHGADPNIALERPTIHNLPFFVNIPFQEILSVVDKEYRYHLASTPFIFYASFPLSLFA